MSLQSACVAGAPEAAEAGRTLLRSGGNAVDGAVACAFALAIADPANFGLFGRGHLLYWNEAIHCLDGATQAPENLDGTGKMAAVPIPGAVFMLAEAHRRWGRRPWEDCVAPAIRLAQEGVLVGPMRAMVWRMWAHELTDPALIPYAAGERRTDTRMIPLLKALAADREALRGSLGAQLAAVNRAQGGCWRALDLAEYEVQNGETIRLPFGNHTLVTIGRQGWGHSLAQMLGLLDRLAPNADDLAETAALTILAAFEDRPETLESRAPKPFPLPHEMLIDPAHLDKRAEQISALSCRADAGHYAEALARQLYGNAPKEDQDTTHFCISDSEGGVVSCTLSLGPHFGARICNPDNGAPYAWSYRTATDPTPGARDVTEMTPAIFLENNRPVFVIGAAGSERIPGAVAQVAYRALRHATAVPEAITAPRVTWREATLRAHADWPEATLAVLRRKGYRIRFSERDPTNHLGIVQGLAEKSAAADPSYDGMVS